VQRRASEKMTRYLAAAEGAKARKDPFKGSSRTKKSTKLPKATLESAQVKRAVKLAVETKKNMKRLERDAAEVKKYSTSGKAKKKSKVFVKHGSSLHQHKTYYHKMGPTPEHVKQKAKKDMSKEATASAQHNSDDNHKSAMDAHAKKLVDHAVNVAAPKVAELRHKKLVQEKLKRGNSKRVNGVTDLNKAAVEAAKDFTKATEKSLGVKPAAAKARTAKQEAKVKPNKLGSARYADIDADVALANKYLQKGKVEEQEAASARDERIEEAKAQAHVLQEEQAHPHAKAPPVSTTGGPAAVSSDIFNSDDGTDQAEEHFANSFGVSLDSKLTIVPGFGASRELGENGVDDLEQDFAAPDEHQYE